MRVLTIIFVLFILLVAPALLTLGIKEVPRQDQGPLVNRQKLYGNINFTQGFVASENGLSAIAITVRNFNLQNKKDIILNVVSENRVVRQAVVNGANIPDGALVKFKFDPISDSSGKKYSLTFSSPNSVSADAFEIYFDEANQLALVDYYRITSRTELIKNIYQSFVSRFVADKIFAVFYLMLIMGLTIYLGI
jgi:hypothetical protein